MSLESLGSYRTEKVDIVLESPLLVSPGKSPSKSLTKSAVLEDGIAGEVNYFNMLKLLFVPLIASLFI